MLGLGHLPHHGHHHHGHNQHGHHVTLPPVAESPFASMSGPGRGAPSMHASVSGRPSHLHPAAAAAPSFSSTSQSQSQPAGMGVPQARSSSRASMADGQRAHVEGSRRESGGDLMHPGRGHMHDPRDPLGLGIAAVVVDPFDVEQAKHVFSPASLFPPEKEVARGGVGSESGWTAQPPRSHQGTASGQAGPAEAGAGVLRYDTVDDRPEGVEDGIWLRVLEMRDAKLALEKVGARACGWV